jgi:hypothetical protein
MVAIKTYAARAGVLILLIFSAGCKPPVEKVLEDCATEVGVNVDRAEVLHFIQWYSAENLLTNNRVYLPTEKLPKSFNRILTNASLRTAAMEATNDCIGVKAIWRGGWAPQRGVWIGKEGCTPWPDDQIAQMKQVEPGTFVFVLKE